MNQDSEPQPPAEGGATAESSTRLLPKARLEAFSDGVFAIVVTLLVLELRVPRGGGPLLHQLVEEWPAYLGYFVSFAFIGGSWIAHSNTTRFIKAADDVLMRLNLLLLLFVSFLPFTTSLMATHLNDSGERLAVVIFGINLTLAALLVSVLVGYAGWSPGLAADDVAEEELQAFERERRYAVALQGMATVVAVFLPVVAVIVFLVVSVLLLVEPLWRARRRRRGRTRR